MNRGQPKIGIIGTGYVGLVSGACFADIGFEVTCLDVIPDKVEKINKAIPPIFENGLKNLLEKVVLKEERLHATLNREETIKNSDLIFICLPTPSDEDGSINLRYIKSEAAEIGKELAKHSDYKVVVVKSTVVPGTTSGVVRELLEKHSGKTAGKDFGLAMNPEFLMEGLAISNFSNPDRVVIGAIDDRSFELVNKLYNSFSCPILKTTTSEAEMIKYAANSFLATKISFINEIGNICEKLGIDVGQVATGMGMDDRISPRFLRAGVGFGGSCFPKDVKALYAVSKAVGQESNILKATLQTNQHQPLRAVNLLQEMLDISGKTIALLGLAFKPETDDMREAPSILIANKLRDLGAEVKGYDPIAKETAEMAIPKITHCHSYTEAVENADAAILVTEWNEFKSLTPRDLKGMKQNILVDGRRVLDKQIFRDAGFKMRTIGQA